MAVVTDFTTNVTSGTFPFIVEFTDTSTGSPDHWLWEFGDGFLSVDQNPTHVYRTGGNFTVKLTAWIEDSVPNVGVVGDNQTFNTVNSGFIFCRAENAQSGFTGTLPHTGWPQIGGNAFVGYAITKSGANWAYEANFVDRSAFQLNGFTSDLYIAWLTLRLGSSTFAIMGTRYLNGVPIAFTVGKLDSGSNEYDGSESTFSLQYLPTDLSDIPIYNLESYFGVFQPIFRGRDGFSYAQKAAEGGTLIPCVGGTAGGYRCQIEYPFWKASKTASADDKDIETKVNYITVNSNIITRPPVLFSGIKEAYFKDGWENEKHFYIEQSKAQPCTIQFVDIYADTENE